MAEAKDSCVKPAKGPIVSGITTAIEGLRTEPIQREVMQMTAKVGKPAPDFEASAYVGGGFRNITLSEFKGRWVVLCFYPGDFTFV
jgi:hypothetical protein